MILRLTSLKGLQKRHLVSTFRSSIPNRMIAPFNSILHRALSTSDTTPERTFKSKFIGFFNLAETPVDDQKFVNAFDHVDTERKGVLAPTEVNLALKEALGSTVPNIDDFALKFRAKIGKEPDDPVTKPQFVETLTKMSAELDPRIWPISTGTLFVGMAVGVILPAMPVLAQEVSRLKLSLN